MSYKSLYDLGHEFADRVILAGRVHRDARIPIVEKYVEMAKLGGSTYFYNAQGKLVSGTFLDEWCASVAAGTATVSATPIQGQGRDLGAEGYATGTAFAKRMNGRRRDAPNDETSEPEPPNPRAQTGDLGLDHAYALGVAYARRGRKRV